MPMLSEREVRRLLADARCSLNEASGQGERERLAGKINAYQKVLGEA